MNHRLVLSMRSFLVVWVSLFAMLRLGCMLKMLKITSMEERDVSDNGKLVAFRLSIWHYEVALSDL